MTIRDKLLLAMTVVLAFVAVPAYVYQRSVVAIRVRLNLVESVDDFSLSISELRRTEKNYLLYPDGRSAEELLAQVRVTSDALKHKAQELTQLEGEAYVHRLDKDFAVYDGLARALVAGGAADQGDRIREQGHMLYESSRSIVRLERERIDEIIRSSQRALAFSVMFVVVLGVLGAFFVGKEIVAPLTRAGDAGGLGGKLRSHQGDRISRRDRESGACVQPHGPADRRPSRRAGASRQARIAGHADLGRGP